MSTDGRSAYEAGAPTGSAIAEPKLCNPKEPRPEQPIYGLSQFSDGEIAREHHCRMMNKLGDQSVGVSVPVIDSIG